MNTVSDTFVSFNTHELTLLDCRESKPNPREREVAKSDNFACKDPETALVDGADAVYLRVVSEQLATYAAACSSCPNTAGPVRFLSR